MAEERSRLSRERPRAGSAARRGRPGWWNGIARHPVITGVFVAGVLAGGLLGYSLLSEEWSALRRVAAGATAGAGSGLLLTATKMFD